MKAALLAVWLLAAFSAVAGDSARIPVRQGRVTDLAGVLSQTELRSLTGMLAAYEAETHHQIAVLTTPTLDGEPIEAFSLRVANAWGVGVKGWDDGILVTLAMRERGIRIEVGRGLERYISNATAKEIIEKDMVPALRKGDYAGGLRAGLQELMEEARRYRIADPHHLPTAWRPLPVHAISILALGTVANAGEH